jgi:hypothetical protein
MKSFVIAAAALIIAQSASAQSYPPATASAAANSPGLWDQSGLQEPRRRPFECLREKATGHRICKSRDEWQQIAARLSRGEPWTPSARR